MSVSSRSQSRVYSLEELQYIWFIHACLTISYLLCKFHKIPTYESSPVLLPKRLILILSWLFFGSYALVLKVFLSKGSVMEREKGKWIVHVKLPVHPPSVAEKMVAMCALVTSYIRKSVCMVPSLSHHKSIMIIDVIIVADMAFQK